MKKEENRIRTTGGLSGTELSREQVDEYLERLEASGCAAATLQSYRRSLTRLCGFLGEAPVVRAGTLADWQEHLLESGYSARTVNVCTAAANGLLLHLGHREFQANRLPEERKLQPELTRAEYLRLLSTARRTGRERAYLLVKVFGTTGLSVGDVERLTAEAVKEGKIELPSETLPLSGGLREELLDYLREEGVASGPVFLTRDGKPQGRTSITKMLKTLCRDARVPEEKASPRCLRKLYLTTRAGIWETLSLLADQSYERLLEKEQRVIGWETADRMG